MSSIDRAIVQLQVKLAVELLLELPTELPVELLNLRRQAGRSQPFVNILSFAPKLNVKIRLPQNDRFFIILQPLSKVLTSYEK